MSRGSGQGGEAEPELWWARTRPVPGTGSTVRDCAPGRRRDPRSDPNGPKELWCSPGLWLALPPPKSLLGWAGVRPRERSSSSEPHRRAAEGLRPRARGRLCPHTASGGMGAPNCCWNMVTPQFPSPGQAEQTKWVWGLDLTDGVEPPNPPRDLRMCTRHLQSSSDINRFPGVRLVYPNAARNRTSDAGQGDSPDPHLHLSQSFLPPLVRLGLELSPALLCLVRDVPTLGSAPCGYPSSLSSSEPAHPTAGWDQLWDHPNPGLIFHQLLSHACSPPWACGQQRAGGPSLPGLSGDCGIVPPLGTGLCQQQGKVSPDWSE